MLNLDRLLTRLGDLPPDRDLGFLEDTVWSRIKAANERSTERFALQFDFGWRAASIAAAAAIGFGVASMGANASPPPLLAVHAPLAPSTILGD